MRDYAQLRPRFWTHGTGKKLRGHHEARELALYLFSAPTSNMIGIYYLPMPTICHELGSPSEGASEALRRVIEVDFASYDHETEIVWVHNMLREQVAESLDPKDNRVKGIIRELEMWRKSPYYHAFIRKYADSHGLRAHLSAADLRIAFGDSDEAPSKPLRSQEQDQDQDQDQEQDQHTHSSSTGKPSLDKRLLDDLIRQVWEFWKSDTGHPKAILDPKRKALIGKRLREGATVDELCAAIRNRRNDPWLMGSGGKIYDGIETLLRDRAQVERLASLSESATGEYPAETREQRDTRELATLERKARAGAYTDKITEQARSGKLDFAKLLKFMRERKIPI